MKARLFLQPCFFYALACVTASHRSHSMSGIEDHTDSTDSTKKRRIRVFYKAQISTNYFLLNLVESV